MTYGVRFPTLAFITGGTGQANEGIPPQPFETFCYDSFHDTWYRTLTEVVGVAFHSQSIDTYNDLFLRSGHRCLFVCAPLDLNTKIVGKC